MQKDHSITSITSKFGHALTAFGDVENNSNVDVEVLGLHGKEDGAILLQRVRIISWITIHLSHRVKTMFTFYRHLSVALVTVGRSAQEVIHTQRTLYTQMSSSTFIKTRNTLDCDQYSGGLLRGWGYNSSFHCAMQCRNASAKEHSRRPHSLARFFEKYPLVSKGDVRQDGYR